MSVPNRSSPLVPVHWPSICRLYIVGTYACTIHEVLRGGKEEEEKTVCNLRLGAFGPSN